MTEHTITLDGEFVIAKGPRGGDWRAETTVDLAAVPASIIKDLTLHGLKQKVADAASGAKTEAEAQGAMDKALAAILAGEWSSRVAGAGVDERARVQRQVARIAMKAKLGAKSPEWAAFTGLSDADQAARLDEVFAKNEAKLRPAVEEKLRLLAEERESRKALAGDLDL